MFGNFFGGEQPKKPVENEKKEINDIGKEIIQEYRNIQIEIIQYIRKFPAEGFGSMPLEDFISEINQLDSDFDKKITKQINKWAERYPEDIDSKDTVNIFIEKISKKIDEYDSHIKSLEKTE